MDPALYWLSIGASIAMFVWLAFCYLRALQKKPHFRRPDVVYQEWFASGCSQKNILTKLGGARNCLRLVVTRKFLWVTSWFPFSLISAFYDLEHVIALDSILSLRPANFMGSRTFLLTYQDVDGVNHTLRLLPKKADKFVQSVGVKIDNVNSPSRSQ